MPPPHSGVQAFCKAKFCRRGDSIAPRKKRIERAPMGSIRRLCVLLLGGRCGDAGADGAAACGRGTCPQGLHAISQVNLHSKQEVLTTWQPHKRNRPHRASEKLPPRPPAGRKLRLNARSGGRWGAWPVCCWPCASPLAIFRQRAGSLRCCPPAVRASWVGATI